MKEAFSPSSSEKLETPPFASHRVRVSPDQNKEKTPLTSENHAFYVGKYIPKKFGQKLLEFVTAEYTDRIYSEEFYLSMLETAFDNLEEGESARIVIAPQFSEIFNGQQDVEEAMGINQQKLFIHKLAKRHFGKRNLIVESIEDQEIHQPLFQELRSAIDPDTNQLDIEKALGGSEITELSDNPNSLEIARYLYAIQKEYEPLQKSFSYAVPRRLRQDMKEDSSMKFYALAEISVRLADIASGKSVQGGVERQGVYDDVIERILKGNSYKKNPYMKKLSELMKDKRFETIHIPTEENPYTAKRRSLAKKSRYAIIATLLAGIGTTFYYAGKNNAEKEQKRVEELVNGTLEQRLEHVKFYFDHKWELPKEKNVMVFNRIVDECMDDISNRYGNFDEYSEKIRTLLQEYLLEHDNVRIIDDNGFERINAVDRFVIKHKLFFNSLGLDLSHPYSNLMKHLEDIEKSAEGSENLTVKGHLDRKLINSSVATELGRNLKYLGKFTSAEEYDNEYEFYLLSREGQEDLLVAEVECFDQGECRGVTYKQPNVKERTFSSERATRGAKQFLYAQQQFDTLPLSEHRQMMREMETWEWAEKEYDDFESPCKGKKRKADSHEAGLYYDKERYADFQGRHNYQFFVHKDYDPKRHLSVDCLLARDGNAEYFTFETAQEMRKRYKEVTDRWYDMYSGKLGE